MKSKAFVQSIGSVGVSSPVLFHCSLIALLHGGHSDREFWQFVMPCMLLKVSCW
jgi:hypothetical protein